MVYGAILYVLVIVLIADKLHCRKLLYWITPFLLLVDLILGKYSVVLFHREFPYILVRNFLFVGIPYFCIGCIISSLPVKIDKCKKPLPFLIALFSATSLIERFVIESVHMNATRDHYISTTFLAIAVFMFTLSRKDKKISGMERTISTIGRKYSTWMYILHPIFIKVISTVMSRTGLFGAYRFMAPVVVYLSTLLFLMCVTHARKCFERA